MKFTNSFEKVFVWISIFKKKNPKILSLIISIVFFRKGLTKKANNTIYIAIVSYS